MMLVACDMLQINIIMDILTVNIQIITVKLPIIILVFILSQFHIHHENDEDVSLPMVYHT